MSACTSLEKRWHISCYALAFCTSLCESMGKVYTHKDTKTHLFTLTHSHVGSDSHTLSVPYSHPSIRIYIMNGSLCSDHGKRAYDVYIEPRITRLPMTASPRSFVPHATRQIFLRHTYNLSCSFFHIFTFAPAIIHVLPRKHAVPCRHISFSLCSFFPFFLFKREHIHDIRTEREWRTQTS